MRARVLFFILLFWICPLVRSQSRVVLPADVRLQIHYPAKDDVLDSIVNKHAILTNKTRLVKDWFYFTNYSRRHPIVFWDSLVEPVLNAYPMLRSAYSQSLKQDLMKQTVLPILLPNEQLFLFAQYHATDLQKNNIGPTHNSSKGESFGERVNQLGHIRCIAENMSFGSSNVLLGLVLLYLDEGLENLGHHKNLLNPKYTAIGIGQSEYNDRILIVQDFGCD